MDVDSQWAATVIFMVALLLITTLAAAETALSTISRSRVRRLMEQNVTGADVALHLLEDFPRLREALALCNLLLVATATGTALVATGLSEGRVAPTVVVVLLATFALQTMASAAGARWYQRVAPALAPLVRLLLFFLLPLRASLWSLNRRLAGSEQLEDEEALRLDEEEMRLLASVVGEEEPEVLAEGREMIHNVVSLAQTTVREVMVPRPDLVALRADSTMQEALDTIIRAGHSRIPVYEQSIDNIIGVLYAKDLLVYLRDGRTNVPLRELLRPALFVPTSRHADELLEDLQGRRVHLAIVFDEYGGTAGLVTIEDILEEIVGEIQDEYDAEEASFVRVAPYEAIVSGRYDIDDLNHEMELTLPTNENDTVGGLVYSALGRVPMVGDEVRMEVAHASLRVETMVGRRIATVRISVDHVEPDEPQPTPAGESHDSAPAPAPTTQLGISRLFFW